jgi:8-oxo-dGTP pyrophosphatase MutT (NUDIX family)
MPDSNKPRLSASVILVEDRPGEDEPFRLFLLKRSDGSSFMPGRYVFPGGVVEESDGPEQGEGLRLCALRELFEEAGVILATDPAAAAGLSPVLKDKARKQVHLGRESLVSALAGLGLVPDTESLVPFARWITPPARAKRFDGSFFLALRPPGQGAEADEEETTQGVWLGPARALEENRAGRVLLAAPQVRMLGELAGFESLEDLLERTGRNIPEPIRPILWDKEGERTIILPWDPDFRAGRPLNRAEPCGAGECSRLVHVKDRWLPFLCPDNS